MNRNRQKLGSPTPGPGGPQAQSGYVFNETGNILVTTTAPDGDSLPDEARALFDEVYGFFTAMTKAIDTSIDPATNGTYSRFDHTAIQRIVEGSGFFVHQAEEDLSKATSSHGAAFSTELVRWILGLAANPGDLPFAQTMVADIGRTGLTLKANPANPDPTVANIFFVCELSLGMPTVRATVISCNVAASHSAFIARPCLSKAKLSTRLTLHKDTYFFVTPPFLKSYPGNPAGVVKDPRYVQLVEDLRALVEGT
ncbi:MAG: hypothetical protein K8J08_20830 [Thermoanaerobaculia bacterium]|nr:hypothetical protein [Thermoanaerobaculia bacterium]